MVTARTSTAVAGRTGVGMRVRVKVVGKVRTKKRGPISKRVRLKMWVKVSSVELGLRLRELKLISEELQKSNCGFFYLFEEIFKVEMLLEASVVRVLSTSSVELLMRVEMLKMREDVIKVEVEVSSVELLASAWI
jgi:hypothetical protein